MTFPRISPRKNPGAQRIGDHLSLTAGLDVLRWGKSLASIVIRTREISVRKLVATPTKLSRLHPFNIPSSNRRGKWHSHTTYKHSRHWFEDKYNGISSKFGVVVERNL